MGRRLDDLGTLALSWRDLLVITRNAPRGSALSRAVNGADWGPAEYLLALVVDVLQSGNWQRAGKPNAPKPKPLQRPGEAPQGQKYGSEPIPAKDFDAWWDNPEGD